MLQPADKQCKHRKSACDCVSFSVYEYMFSLTSMVNSDRSEFTEAFDDLQMFLCILENYISSDDYSILRIYNNVTRTFFLNSQLENVGLFFFVYE